MARNGNDPTVQDWNEAKGLIHNLYISRNFTARGVARVMADSYDFHASVRMYKDRFKKWNMDCKTIRQPVWEQMAEIYAYRRDYQHKDTVFEVTVGEARKLIGYKQIAKHFMRVDPSKPSTIDKETFDRIVNRSQLTFWRPSPPPNTDPSSAHIRYFERTQSRSEMDSPTESNPPPDQSTKRLGSATLGPIRPSTDIGIIEMMRGMSLTAPCNEAIKDQVAAYSGCQAHHDCSRPLEMHEARAGEWVFACFATCVLHNQDMMREANKHRQKAMEIFAEMIRTANEQVLPGLLWVTSMMTAQGHDFLLKQFLLDGFEVNEQWATPNQIYRTIFGYCLAVLDNNDPDIEMYGSTFSRHDGTLRHVWGEDSPSVLINSYYWAWHLLREHKYNQVIGLMQQSLTKSEKVMGSCHPVTVNCLAILSRAYDDQNQVANAIGFLDKAVERSYESSGGESPFRLKLLRRLAMLHRRASNIQETERILREVVDGRVRLLGLSNGYTWGAIYDLVDVLTDLGKESEAHELRREMDQQFQRERTYIAPTEAHLTRRRS